MVVKFNACLRDSNENVSSTHLHVVPNPYDFLTSKEHKWKKVDNTNSSFVLSSIQIDRIPRLLSTH